MFGSLRKKACGAKLGESGIYYSPQQPLIKVESYRLEEV